MWKVVFVLVGLVPYVCEAKSFDCDIQYEHKSRVTEIQKEIEANAILTAVHGCGDVVIGSLQKDGLGDYIDHDVPVFAHGELDGSYTSSHVMNFSSLFGANAKQYQCHNTLKKCWRICGSHCQRIQTKERSTPNSTMYYPVDIDEITFEVELIHLSKKEKVYLEISVNEH
ncbi:MAG: hypothetical protein R3A11_06850 [Bdellovibrionota bacterium]